MHYFPFHITLKKFSCLSILSINIIVFSILSLSQPLQAQSISYTSVNKPGESKMLEQKVLADMPTINSEGSCDNTNSINNGNDNYLAGSAFCEDFNDTILAPEWFWMWEDNSNWSLTTRPDFLRINTQIGTIYANNILPNNLLLRPAMVSDYELIVRFEGEFTQNFHEAILTLFIDDDNYILVNRLYNDIDGIGDVYAMGGEENGIPFQTGSSASATGIATELRLVVTKSFVMGFYKNGVGDWILLSKFAVNGIDNYPLVGISAFHGDPNSPISSISVDFDYVLAQSIETGMVFLPLVTSSP